MIFIYEFRIYRIKQKYDMLLSKATNVLDGSTATLHQAKMLVCHLDKINKGLAEQLSIEKELHVRAKKSNGNRSI